MNAAATDESEFITLPAVSVRTGCHLDRLRRLFVRREELRSLLVRVGDRRLIRTRDLDKVRELLASH